MTDRAQKYEAFLDELAPIVDADPDALERHADFLADDDDARDLRHDAAGVAQAIGWAGADYVPPADLEARLLAALDGADGGRTTSPGFAAPDAARLRESPAAPAEERPPVAGASTLPVSVAMPAVEAPVTSDAPAAIDEALRPTREPVAPTLAVSSSSVSSSAPVHAAPAPKSLPARGGPRDRKGLLLFLVPAAGVAALAAAALLGLAIFGGDDDAVPEPTLATAGIEGTLESIERAAADGQSGVTVRRPGSDAFVALSAGEALVAGSVVKTDERTRASVVLSDGSRLVLNHQTELELMSDAARSLRVRDGDIVADIAHIEGAPHAFFHTATGHVEVLGTKFELAASGDVTSVRVTRGAVSVAGADGRGAEVRAGEEGVVRAGATPEVSPVTDLARAMAWSELGGEEAAEGGDSLPGIGSLRARRPGEQQDRERPLAVASQKVTVRIVGNVARTEIEQVFRNDDDHTLEGIYRFPLPPDAQIARLALDVEGRMEEGSFVERDRAAAIWRGVIRNATAPRQRRNDEEFIWVPGPWHDPAILEWQRGGQFELRIFPIPAHGERRVILAYTQQVAPQGDRRRYVYPLAHSADGSTSVGRFEVDVRVAGAERVAASGYRVQSAAEDDATRLRLTEEGFVPKGDLAIEYELPGAERELSYWTYRGEAAAPPPEDSREQDREVQEAQRQLAQDQRGYVAFALRPRLPRATERRDRDYVLVVDASQSMVGERFTRASSLATHVVGEMDRRDRFTVLACDYGCRALPGGLMAPSAQAAQRASEWLESIEPAGASDLVAVVREAAASVEGERRDGRELHVVYVGDGVSTAGYRRASSLSAEVRQVAEASDIVVSTVGIGGDADTLALSAIATASGGHYVPYVPGQRTTVAAMSVLETTYGVSLESPRLTLPSGLVASAPSELPTIRAGQEVVVVARMDRERVQGDVVLRGEVAGRPFEQRYTVDLTASEAAGNRFVPRLWAAGQIDEMQLRGRGDERAKIIAMSKAFGVLSRHTSLLVLESEAMFRAFRVDRNESAPAGWTGEEDIETGGAEGQLALGDGQGVGQGYGGLRGFGRVGTMGAGAPVAAPAPARRARAQSATGTETLDPWGGGGAAPSADRDRSARPMREESRRAAPEAEAPADRADWRWNDMPAPQPAAPPAMTATPGAPVMRPRLPGRYMRRVWYRAGSVDPSTDVTNAEREAARRAEAALRENEDSRDRHREAVRQLSRAGDLRRALEVADAWIERDRLDPEALTAKADILGRLGRRDDALRLLTGTVDLSPNSEALHTRLANAFDRAGRPERACAHRIALAEIDESDSAALAAAVRCERALGRASAVERLMSSVRDPDVRVRAERLANQEDEEARFRGDFTIEGEWDEGVDLDLGIVTSQGTRLSWMGGRTTVRGEDATRPGRERLGLRYTGAGTYYVEVSRIDPSDTREVRGELRIRVLGQTRTVPFTLRGARETVARVRVTRESRLEPVTGTVPMR